MASRNVVMRKPQWAASRMILCQLSCRVAAWVDQADDDDQYRKLNVNVHAAPCGSGASDFAECGAGQERRK